MLAFLISMFCGSSNNDDDRMNNPLTPSDDNVDSSILFKT